MNLCLPKLILLTNQILETLNVGLISVLGETTSLLTNKWFYIAGTTVCLEWYKLSCHHVLSKIL